LFGNQSYVRKAGEALHPERDSVETYQKIREAVGEYNFQSQYQQDPAAREGGLIKREWIKYYETDRPRSRFRWITQSWDTANKAGEFNDYSVCTTWGVEGINFYLLDVFRKKLNYPQLKRAAIDLYRKLEPFNILIEDKSSGISLIQELQAEYIYYVVACTSDPGSDKYMRLATESIKFESGRVYLPTQAPWLEDYVREITSFPGSKYADQVDSTSQALKYLGEDIVGPAYT
jgi:predicted phage terminase large subunit-like protein